MNAIIKNILIWWMWYPLRVTIRFLPMRGINTLGKLGGFLLYLMSRNKRRLMTNELFKCLPDKSLKEIKKAVKGTFVNYCLSELTIPLYPIMNETLMKKMVRIEGKMHLDKALEEEQGVLLFQAHFGAFQMTMPAIGYNGYTMNQISASATVWKEGMNSEIQKKSFDIKADYEYKLPVKHISFTSTLRPVFRALERNEIVGITIDGGSGKKYISIPFLGRNANFSKGPVELAIRTGAKIIPAFIVTEKQLMHTLYLHPPIKIDEHLNKEENIQNVIESFVKLLESYVCRYPEHYGYFLYFRRANEAIDPYPFVMDY